MSYCCARPWLRSLTMHRCFGRASADNSRSRVKVYGVWQVVHFTEETKNVQNIADPRSFNPPPRHNRTYKASRQDNNNGEEKKYKRHRTCMLKLQYKTHGQGSSNIHMQLGGATPLVTRYCGSNRCAKEGRTMSCELVYTYKPFDGTDNVASTLSFCAPVKVAN